MISISQSPGFEMNVSHLDDKMELATSPYPQFDDIDVDFEPDRQQSVDRSMADETEMAINNPVTVQADQDHIFNDDDMLDDATLQTSDESALEDLNMESYDGEQNHEQDEDDLYDEEETGSVTMVELQDEIAEQMATEISLQPEVDITLDMQGETRTHEPSNTDPNIDTTDLTSNIEDGLGGNTLPIGTHTLDTGVAETEVVDFANQDFPAPHENRSLVNDPELDNDNVNPAPEDERHSPKIQNIDLHNPPVELSHTEPIPNPVAQDIKECALSNEGEQTGSVQEPLHPITVIYLGQEMSFFPPMADDASATFFLADSSLAYEPVEKLLSSCREILGDTLEHDDELVLDISALGLHICEDSKFSTQITLAQVVEVYLNLSRNENTEDIEPLLCSLSSRVCLGSQYAYLAACAAEGKTFSEIAADYADSPEHEAYKDHVEVTELEENPATISPTHNEERILDAENHDLDQNGEEQSVARDAQVDADAAPIIDSSRTAEALTRNPDPVVTEEIMLNPKPDQQSTGVDEQTTLSAREGVSTDRSGRDVITNHLGNNGSSHDTTEALQDEDESASSSGTLEDRPATESKHRTSGSHQDLDGHIAEVDSDLQGAHEEDLDAYDLGEDLFKDELEDIKPNIEDPESFEEVSDQAVPQLANGSASTTSVPETAEDLIHEEIAFDDFDVGFTNDADTNDNDVDADADANDFDHLQSVNVDDYAPDPTTPSKQNGHKRKMLSEEDELDFLDFSTPEPKRTRAS